MNYSVVGNGTRGGVGGSRASGFTLAGLHGHGAFLYGGRERIVPPSCSIPGDRPGWRLGWLVKR